MVDYSYYRLTKLKHVIGELNNVTQKISISCVCHINYIYIPSLNLYIPTIYIKLHPKEIPSFPT